MAKVCWIVVCLCLVVNGCTLWDSKSPELVMAYQEIDLLWETIELLLEDYLERHKPERSRSRSIYGTNYGIVTEVPLSMIYELLGDDGEWHSVSEKEFESWMNTEQLKIQSRKAKMLEVLQHLKVRPTNYP